METVSNGTNGRHDAHVSAKIPRHRSLVAWATLWCTDAGTESEQDAPPVSDAPTRLPDPPAGATETAPPSSEYQPPVAQEIPTKDFVGLRLRPPSLNFHAASGATPAEPGAQAAMALWKGQPIWLPRARPLVNIGLTIGAAFGGGQLLRATYTDGHTEDLHAGAGFVAALGFNSMTYDGPGGSVNADSFSLWLTMSGGVQHRPRLSDGPPN